MEKRYSDWKNRADISVKHSQVLLTFLFLNLKSELLKLHVSRELSMLTDFWSEYKHQGTLLGMLLFSPSVSSMFIQYKPSKIMKWKRRNQKHLWSRLSNLQKQLVSRFFFLNRLLTSQCLVSNYLRNMETIIPTPTASKTFKIGRKVLLGVMKEEA